MGSMNMGIVLTLVEFLVMAGMVFEGSGGSRDVYSVL